MAAVTTPTSTIRLYGIPCDECGSPAHHVDTYPNGRRIVHIDPRRRPCDQFANAAASKP